MTVSMNFSRGPTEQQLWGQGLPIRDLLWYECQVSQLQLASLDPGGKASSEATWSPQYGPRQSDLSSLMMPNQEDGRKIGNISL